MPIETPHGISRRVPPRSFHNGLLLRGLGIPDCIFERRLGHAMATHFSEQGRTFAGRVESLSQQRGNQVLCDRRPGALDPFAAVEGIFADDAFAPTVDAFAMDGDEKNAAAVGATKARLEKVDERHLNFTESDGFNFHVFVFELIANNSPQVARASYGSEAYDHFSSQ